MMRRKGLSKNSNESLTSETKTRVRFNEVDPLGIVWHGNYIRYFEDGREDFGRSHGISYLDVKANGYSTPIVKSVCEHKLPLRYGDVAEIKTIYVDSPAAKMIFEYEIYNSERKIVCTGQTIQVFVQDDGGLSLTMPSFFAEWKQKMGLL